MQVFAMVDDSRRDAHRHADGTFKCYPKGSNLVEKAKTFSELRDAAAFLVANPDWGIRMQPGSPIVYEGIQIVRR